MQFAGRPRMLQPISKLKECALFLSPSRRCFCINMRRGGFVEAVDSTDKPTVLVRDGLYVNHSPRTGTVRPFNLSFHTLYRNARPQDHRHGCLFFRNLPAIEKSAV